ncbi:hypothetical protein MMC11_004316 [Xylographa trunciseda]|nr:hypothetical protein [Xylographa trunciseda]
MYCGPVANVATLSYSNLISTGSTAYPPTLGAILTAFPTSALESILSADIGCSTNNAATSTGSTVPSSTVSSTPGAITGITGIVTVTTTSVHPAPSTRTSSSTMNSTISNPSRDSAQAPGPLSSGAIAGISIGSAVFALLIMALISYFCIRPYLYRRAMLRNSHTPRGTLGGATLPGPQQPINTYEAPRRYVNIPREDRNDMNNGHQHSQNNIRMASYGSQRPLWNASGVGDARGHGIAELHGETRSPVYEEEIAVRRLLAENIRPASGHNSKSPVTPHAQVAGRPTSEQRHPANAVELECTERSASGPNSPSRGGLASLRHSMPSSPSMTVSRTTSRKNTRLSATGSYGYVSPEQAMAGGLNNNEEDDSDEEEE